jgi:hypothetical protein
MAKLIQIQVVTVPLSSATGPVGTAEVMYALDDTGRIWRLDPRIQPASWHEFDAPPLSIP